MKLIFATIIFATAAAAAIAQAPAPVQPCSNTNYRAQVLVLRIDHIIRDAERLQISIDQVSETIDTFDDTIAEQTANLQTTRNSIYEVDADQDDKTPADAEKRRQADIEETESNIRTNSQKRAVQAARLAALQRRLDAANAQLASMESELSRL